MWSTNSCLVLVMFWQISHSILLMDVVQGLLWWSFGVIPPYWASLSWELRSFWRSREAISDFVVRSQCRVCCQQAPCATPSTTNSSRPQTWAFHPLLCRLLHFNVFVRLPFWTASFYWSLNRIDHTVWSRGQDEFLAHPNEQQLKFLVLGFF